jgi:hypothetical protein
LHNWLSWGNNLNLLGFCIDFSASEGLNSTVVLPYLMHSEASWCSFVTEEIKMEN